MSAILGTGEVPIKAGKIAADNAIPIPVSFVDERGIVTGVVVGGLTKRQELAARFFSAMIPACEQLKNNEITVQMWITALRMADQLLDMTEPPRNG